MSGRRLTAAEAVEILREMVSGGRAGLEGGAEFEVLDETGRSVLLAALARQVRLAEEGIIWIRPIVGGYRPDANDAPAHAFDLNTSRRRALDALEFRCKGDEIVLWLQSGERAHIRPIGRRTKPDLEQWDRFFYNAIDADEQLEMDSLSGDA